MTNDILTSLHKIDNYVIKLRAKDILFKEKMPISNLYFIESGLVKIVEQRGSQSIIQQLLPKGNFVGLFDLLLSNEYTSTAFAADDTSLRLYVTEGLQKYFLSNPDVASSVIRSIKYQELALMQNYIHLLRYPVDKRVENFLKWLSVEVYESPEFSIKLDRSDIAGYLSTSVKTLNRILKQLKEQGKINISGKKFKFL